ncbi:MAG: DUF885 domain-containing protein [Planctomycetaceae bacterium]
MNSRPSAASAQSADDQFEKLAAQFIDEYPALSPIDATALGDHRFDSQIDDLSPAARAKQREFYQRWQKQLAGVSRSDLSRQNQIDYSLLKRKLEHDQWNVDRLQEWAWNPIAYTQLAGQSIYGLMSREFAPVEERLESVAGRLEQFPRMYEQTRKNLDPKRVPQVHAETAVKQNKGVLSIIKNMVEPELDNVSPELKARIEQAIALAKKTVLEHQEWLEQELLPNARGDFRIGLELYDEKLAHALSGALTRAEIRERSEFRLKETREEMYGIARNVLGKEKWPESPTPEQQQAAIVEALELANQDIPPRDGVIEAAEKSMEITTAFIKSKDLMSIPDDPLKIIVMPEFQRGVSVAYCDSPGALEVGQQTYYAVAPLPTDWTDEQCKSFLREYNIRSIHNLTVHEAMPGHFVQLAMSNRYPSKLRAVLASGTFIEGWACYTEQMCSDEGLLDGDPLMRLVTLKWNLRGIANAILDQNVHVNGMTREQAMHLMTHDTFQEEREAAGKWIRAQVTSAQLSTYFVGVEEHFDMREKVQKKWSSDFTLKKYHDTVVSFGSPPVRFVQALLLEEAIPE